MFAAIVLNSKREILKNIFHVVDGCVTMGTVPLHGYTVASYFGANKDSLGKILLGTMAGFQNLIICIDYRTLIIASCLLEVYKAIMFTNLFCIYIETGRLLGHLYFSLISKRGKAAAQLPQQNNTSVVRNFQVIFRKYVRIV